MDGESPQRDAERFAYVTLVTSDGYVDGALVLLHSLRRTLTPHSVLCLVTPSALSSGSLQRLHQHFDGVIETDLQQSTDDRNLALLGRPDLRSTLTKIQLWHPALFGAWSAICYLDADTLVRQPIDDIFSRFYAWRADEPGWRRGGLAAAAPDTGWPDCFNSGVLLLAPGLECYQGLIRRASQSNASFDGADQGLLNEHFADWATARPYRRLPFLYNATANVYYTYEPALQRFGHDVRVVHFIGISKPWHWERTPGGQLQSDASTSERWRQLVSLWWNIHDEHVSGWNYWRGPFDKNVAFGEGYHHVTEPVGQPEPHSGHGGDSHLSESQPHLDGGQVPEVSDWEKDWTWAVDRVHPLDYAYLVPRAKATPEPDPSESSQQSSSTQRLHVKQHHEHAQPRHLQPARDYPSEAVHSAAAQRDAPNWAADMHYDNANGSQWQSIEQSCPESPCQRQEDERKPVSAPPAWMHSGRPWEDVAREGWMHHGDYKPHVYDQAYIQRHVDTPYPVELHGQSQPAAQYHQQQEPHRDHYWQPEYTPMPLPHNQPIYEAAQVVLQPHIDDHKGHHDPQYPSENTAGQHWERDHHDISYRPPREHHDASHNQNHSDHEIMYAPAPAYPFQHHCNYKHDQPYHEHGGDQPYQPAPVDRHDGQSTSSGSPLYYPQPKSPMVVNPVALWESSEEQARRRAWAQRVQEPINEAGSGTHLQHNTPWATPAPAADQRIPPSSMDHIDSSQLPQGTPWKVSHVRHRPAGGMAANGNPQSPHLGMQFKEGVANDSNARDAAGQLLKRWNEAVIARNIQSKFGDIDPDHISHSVAAPEKGIDAIRLETTVSCEAEDSKGERTVYRFTLSSTLDIGGAKGAPAAMAPASIPSQQTINAYSSSKPSQNEGHLDNPPAAYHTEPLALDGRVPDAIDIDDGGSEGVARDYANATSLRQPENYHEPAISRRSSFVQLQRNATRAPHMALRSGYDNDDQFAESDARYWRLQRQLIDLEMSQRLHDAPNSEPASPMAGNSNGMSGQSDGKLDLVTPPTPSYQQPIRRRPSAFSVADSAAFAQDSAGKLALPIAVAPKGGPDADVTRLSRRRSRSSPRLAVDTTRPDGGMSAKPNDGQPPTHPKRSRSYSTLRRIAAENSAQAAVQSSKPQGSPTRTRHPVFITSSPDSSDSESDGAEKESGEEFKPASGRTPTPFPRNLRKTGAGDGRSNTTTDTGSSQLSANAESGKRDNIGPVHNGAGLANFGLPHDATGSDQSPSGQKLKPKMIWGDDDDNLLPPEDDRSIDAQWRRIVYGAPPPRASVASTVDRKQLVTTSSAGPAHEDNVLATEKTEQAPIELSQSSGAAVLDSDKVSPTLAAGASGVELGDDATHKLIGDESPETTPSQQERKPAGSTRAPPRKLHSARSFLNLTSQTFDTLSDSDADPSDAELEKRFWERAIKPSRSGISTPYSPGRRKSVVEMSSLISPKDLEEWMRWQGDSSDVLVRGPADEIPDVLEDETSAQLQDLITPPTSKSKEALVLDDSEHENIDQAGASESSDNDSAILFAPVEATTLAAEKDDPADAQSQPLGISMP